MDRAGSARGATSSASRVREITLETLVQASKLTVGKTEHLDQYLKRVTHVTLNGNGKKVFTKIQLLEKCPNLKVLYMYDNEVETIKNLEGVSQLTHLHLQNNWIHKMEGLLALSRLEKLYIEGNRVSRLEGLSGCTALQELHLSNQNLTNSDEFTFEEASIRALSRSLRVLNLAGCHVRSAQALSGLRALQQLNLSRNDISELEEVFGLLSSLAGLVELDLRFNPVTILPKYREKAMTFSSSRLTLLDKKDIDANQRRMMQSHLAHKFQKRQEPEASSNQPTAARATSTSETIRKMKHGSTVHQLRAMPISSNGAVPQWDKDGLGVAGAACPSSSTVLVRPSSGSNNNYNNNNSNHR